MTVKEILAKLESMGDETRRTHNAKVGPDGTAPPANQFGVPMAEIRALAKKIKADHALALKLWESGNLEAQLLATLLLKSREISAKELDTLTRSTTCALAADWLNGYVVAQHSERDALRKKWIKDKNRWAARAAWRLTASLVNNGADSELDLDALLGRIEKEMPRSQPEVQWTMNSTLIAIGVKHGTRRSRAVAIGESIGLYSGWPKSKGCIIPYAPVAIEALAKREK